ncbi:MAG: calcium-binding protein, partial [Gaiellaceae bacterium]
GTDVSEVVVDLASTIGGNAGDGAADLITANGTNGVDLIDVAAAGGGVQVTGLAADVRIAHADLALDQLIVNTLAGVDQVNVGAGVAGLIGVTVIQ